MSRDMNGKLGIGFMWLGMLCFLYGSFSLVYGRWLKLLSGEWKFRFWIYFIWRVVIILMGFGFFVYKEIIWNGIFSFEI